MLKYFVLSKAEGVDLVKSTGLNDDGKFHVYNPNTFTAYKNQMHYEKGDLSLAPEEIDAYISWQIDEDGSFGVFTRQEDVIRLMRKKLVKPRLSTVTKNFGTVNTYTKTNLGMRDLLKLAGGYLAKGSDPMEKETVPVLGTYELSEEIPRHLKRVEWTENPIKLRSELW